MSKFHGTFIWYDVMTSDAIATETFYRAVFGWNTKDSGLSDRTYTVLSVGSRGMGGLMPIPATASVRGAKPGWLGYIAVDDVDQYAARIKSLGGAVHRGPEDIPGIGRFAVVADMQGAIFVLMRGSSDQVPEPVVPGTPGHVGWHELMAGNGEAAFAFYADLFGWTKTEALDMGPMGIYQLFAIQGMPCGGMMTKPPEMAAPFWRYYFNVDHIDAAMTRVTSNGGQVTNDPMPVPKGSWIAHCLDPQGAPFAIVGPRS